MADYLLSAATQAAMQTSLSALGYYSGGNYKFAGSTADGGSWKLVVIGNLNSPAFQSTLEPIEPGIFTNHVGQPEEPEAVTGTNFNVGIESIPDTAPAARAHFWWNSGLPSPNFAGQGLTVVLNDSQGSQAAPFGGHF